jgi:hypothetical protein
VIDDGLRGFGATARAAGSVSDDHYEAAAERDDRDPILTVVSTSFDSARCLKGHSE